MFRPFGNWTGVSAEKKGVFFLLPSVEETGGFFKPLSRQIVPLVQPQNCQNTTQAFLFSSLPFPARVLRALPRLPEESLTPVLLGSGKLT